MRYYLRQRHPGASYFFTVVTHKRRPILTLPENIARLRQAIRHVKQHHPFFIDGIVILPDHLHTLWQLPAGDDNYPMRWAQIKRCFTMSLAWGGTPDASRKRKREQDVWQRRYWEHQIRNDEDWQRHMDYIHYNPVKHGYVLKAEEWPYSSLASCQRKGWYEAGWGGDVSEAVLRMRLE